MRRTLIAVTIVFLLGVAAANLLTAILLAGTGVGLYLLQTKILDRLIVLSQTQWIPRLIRSYERSLRWALAHRMGVLGICAAVFVGTFGLFTVFNNGIEFFPEDVPPAQLLVNVDAPVGTRIEFTDNVTRTLEAQLAAIPGYDDAESVVSVSGSGGGMDMFGGGVSGENQARITLSMVDFNLRGQDSFETLALLQERIGRELPGVEISADMPAQGPSSAAPVNVEIVGADPLVLKRLADRVLEVLRGAPVGAKLVGLESDLDDARSELSVHVDREKAALYDLSTSDVGLAVRGAIQGVEAAKYRTGNDEFDIVVRLGAGDRSVISALEDLVVVAEGGAQIPLVSVADWDVGEGLGSIRRKDMDRLATVSSDVRAGLNQNAVLLEVQETLVPFMTDELPSGYQLRYTGQVEEQAESQAFLGLAFGIALLLITFILISQFNSLVKPLIILSSVIMSTVGVLVGLMVFNMPFVVIMTGVGVISLAGIVVNNAIVLIDYIDTLRTRDGMDRREALVQAGLTRFRPVILTAITTALGLIPLAVGLNFDFIGLFRNLNPDLFWGGEQAAWWSPMAIAVIVGILVATLLTLIVVPVMYGVVDDLALFFRRHYIGEEAPVGAESAGGTVVAGGNGMPQGSGLPQPEPALR
jgi:multidrug efflux pump subunit AcrB